MTTYNLPIHCQLPDCGTLFSDFQNFGYSVSEQESIIYLSGRHFVEHAEQGLVLRPIRPEEKNEVLRFEKEVLDSIPHNLDDNICQSLSSEELDHSFRKDHLVGLFQGNQLQAFLLFVPRPEDWQNSFLDLHLDFPEEKDNLVIVDSIWVGQEYRGYGIQHFLFLVAESFARSHGFPLLCGVASPKNTHSNANFLKSGYELAATLPKYSSTRNFYLRKL